MVDNKPNQELSILRYTCTCYLHDLLFNRRKEQNENKSLAANSASHLSSKFSTNLLRHHHSLHKTKYQQQK